MRGRVDPVTGSVSLGGLSELKDTFKKARRLIICACGTSWHSGLVGEYLIENLAKLSVEVEYASEFRYRNPLIYEDDIVIAISQSGETADTLEAIRIAKNAGAKTMGIVNVVGSSIARLTDAGIYLHVGPEIGVASTKAFSGQICALTMFAIWVGQLRGCLSDERAQACGLELLSMPGKIESMLSDETIKRVQHIASVYRFAKNFLFLGRGYNFPVALEGALKLKEISYIHAEGYPAAEMKHGPIALVDEMMPVVVIAQKLAGVGSSGDAVLYEKVVSGIEEVVARKGSVIVITDEGNRDLDDKAEFVLETPTCSEYLSPLITCVHMQLLSYYIAKLRGCEIDQPRNLAKAVCTE
jgi:glucosamine--fructose-6-phosphate aminotransferase (isomerizing)